MIMKVKNMKLNNRKLYNKMFFREFDVLHHIKPNDFWVVLNRRVLDLSQLVQLIDELPSNNNDLTVRISLTANFILKIVLPVHIFIHKRLYFDFVIFFVAFFASICVIQALHQLCMFGGTDVSKLFSDRKGNQLEMFNLKSNTEYGRLHGCFWWNDPVLIVGSITARERHICVRNKSKGKLEYICFDWRVDGMIELTKYHLHLGTQRHLTVCEEDSIYAIRAKFCAVYSENENMIWRKRESTVSFFFLHHP